MESSFANYDYQNKRKKVLTLNISKNETILLHKGLMN